MFSRLHGLFFRAPQLEDSIALLDHHELDEASNAESNIAYPISTHAAKINELLTHLQTELSQLVQHRLSIRRKIFLYSTLFVGTSLTLLVGSGSFIGVITKMQLEVYD